MTIPGAKPAPRTPQKGGGDLAGEAVQLRGVLGVQQQGADAVLEHEGQELIDPLGDRSVEGCAAAVGEAEVAGWRNCRGRLAPP